jgi:hypothetical protein
MSQAANKLARALGVEAEVAEALVAAGYNYPRKIHDATDEALLKIRGRGRGQAGEAEGTQARLVKFMGVTA